MNVLGGAPGNWPPRVRISQPDMLPSFCSLHLAPFVLLQPMMVCCHPTVEQRWKL
jgi:hypothetical protein